MRLFVLARPSAKQSSPAPGRHRHPRRSGQRSVQRCLPRSQRPRRTRCDPVKLLHLPQDHHGACDQQNHSHHRFVDAFVEHDDPAEQRGRHRRREQYPQLLPIDGFVAIERPGRIRRGDDVERQRRWTHLRCRKGGERHQGQECGPAGLTYGRIQQRDEAEEQSEQGGDPKSMS